MYKDMVNVVNAEGRPSCASWVNNLNRSIVRSLTVCLPDTHHAIVSHAILQ